MPLSKPFPYLISYDLKTPNGDYDKLISELKKSDHWWHFLDSTWLVLRRETLTELGPKLRGLIHQEDRLLIMPAQGPADGWLPKEAWTWINDKIPNAW